MLSISEAFHDLTKQDDPLTPSAACLVSERYQFTMLVFAAYMYVVKIFHLTLNGPKTHTHKNLSENSKYFTDEISPVSVSPACFCESIKFLLNV